MEIFTFLLFIIAGIVSGFFNGMIGAGGGLLSIPLTVLFGLPLQTAVATDKFGTLGSAVSSFSKFWKRGKIDKNTISIFVFLAIIASVLGSMVLLSLDNQTLAPVIALIMIVLLPIILLKDELNLQRFTISNKFTFIKYGFYLAALVMQVAFGSGIGLLAIMTLHIFFGFTLTESNANHKIATLVFSVISIIIYSLTGLISYWAGVGLFIGNYLSGKVGAEFAMKNSKLVKTAFAAAVILALIKMELFP